MSKTQLAAGDIVADPVLGLGLVMRPESENALLVAFPGLDELVICQVPELSWIATLKDF